MPSARTVVEDSDEDEDVLSPARDLQAAVAIADSGAGTGSTEQLMRDIERAHGSLFNNGACDHLSFVGVDDNVSEPGSPSAQAKRRKTRDGKSICSNFLDQCEIGGPTSCGTARSADGLSNDSGDGNLLAAAEVQIEDIASDGKSSSQSRASLMPKSSHEQQLQDDAAAAWNMRGSMLLDFAQHEPVTMFASNAEIGSTVPDNTYTQQRLIKEALKECEETGCASPHSLALQSDGSLRSSAFRTTQATNKSPPNCKSSAPARETKSSQLLPGDIGLLKQEGEEGCDDAPPPAPRGTTPSTDAQYSQSPPKTSLSKDSKKDHGLVTHPTTEPCSYQDLQIELAEANDRLALGNSDMAAGAIPRKGDEATHSLRTTIAATKRKRKSELEALQQLEKSQTCPGDLDAKAKSLHGLPQERYDPRPSRSRSAQSALVLGGDFDVDPEALLKESRKRRKTFEARDTASPTCERHEPRIVDTICNMGFARTRAIEALTLSGGILETAVELLVQEEGRNSEKIVPEIVVTPKQGLSLNPAVANPTRAAAVDAEQPVEHEKGRVTVSVQIPVLGHLDGEFHDGSPNNADSFTNMTSDKESDGGSSAMAGRRLKSRQSELPQDGSERQGTPATDTKSTLLATTKRGRGRPRKVPQKIITEDEAAEAEAISGEDEPLNHEQRADEDSIHLSRTPKGGRGRPRSVRKKDDNMTVHCDGLDVTDRATRPIDPVSTELGDRNVLQDLDTNCNTAAGSTTHNDDASVEHASNGRRCTQVLTPASSPRQMPPPPAAPVTPAKQKTSTVQRSPTSKGKVTYRVGLSKHARIPSLLKSMKK